MHRMRNRCLLLLLLLLVLSNTACDDSLNDSATATSIAPVATPTGSISAVAEQGLDTSLPWQSESRENVTVLWHEDNDEFPEAIFAQLDYSFTEIEEKLGFVQTETIDIFILHDSEEMRPLLNPTRTQMFAGISPPLGAAKGGRTVFLVYIRHNWKERLTHELTHLLTVQLVGDPWNPPFWLDEGLAEYTSRPVSWLPPNPVPISQLATLPESANQRAQGYAQAWSLVTFLIEEKGGKENIHQLLTTIAEGTAIDDALLSVYGFDEEGLDEEWREWAYPPP